MSTPVEFCTLVKPDICRSVPSSNQDAGQAVIIVVLLSVIAVLVLVFIIVIIVIRWRKKRSYVVNQNGTYVMNPVYNINERNMQRETQVMANPPHHFTCELSLV